MARPPFFLPKIVLTGVAATVLVSACAQPHSFPTGYTYHNREFKSATPPPSKKFTDEQRATMTAEQAAAFRMAIYSLVESLTSRAGMPPRGIYIAKPERMTPFYANMDNDLRESMRHMGYRLADIPEDAYVFTYSAQAYKEDETPVDPPVQGQPPANIRVALQVYSGVGEDATMLTEEARDFYIPGARELHIPFTRFPFLSSQHKAQDSRSNIVPSESQK